MPNKLSNIKIRPTLLTVVSLVAIIGITITLSLQYYFSKQLAYQATNDSTNHIAQKAIAKIVNLDKTTSDLISQLELSKNIDSLNIIDSKESLAKNKFVKAMANKNYIYAIYVGFENGDFYEIINLDMDQKLRIKYNAIKNERWLLIKISKKDNVRLKRESFLDKNLNFIRENKTKTKYNPTKRPWYISALKSKDIIKTSPYQFTNLDGKGVTYAKKILNSKNIIGVDISLRSLTSFLKKQQYIEQSKLFIFEEQGDITASNIEKEFFDDYKNILTNSINIKDNTIHIQNRAYFINTINLNSYNKKEYFSILTPKDIILKPYNEKIWVSLIINVVLLLFIIPVVLYFSKIIVDPIKKLEVENEKIRQRKFDDIEKIDTQIYELNELSNSLVSMSISIKEYQQAQKKLMDSFIELIANAIDEKSKYTGGHCMRVPLIAIQLANKASDSKEEVFKDFYLNSDDEIREISIAAWLHDCGKMTTPEFVVDKATKLETIYNRIHEIRTRFEVVYRDLEIQYYKKLQNGENKDDLDKWLKESKDKLHEDFAFIAKTNIGGEFMKEEDKDRINQIAKISWNRYFDNSIGLSYDEMQRYDSNQQDTKEYILSDKKSHIVPRDEKSNDDDEKYGFKTEVPDNLYNFGEIYNLCVERGTLTNEERYKINEHINITIKMLEQLPFPESLRKVPEYAGAHHETLIGTGYPRGLTKEQMSIPARILALADVFEALTASDRPYKKAKTLSESIKILSFMVKDKHLDEDIFKLFLTSKIYLDYAKEHLLPEQIDEVDISQYV